MYVLLTKLDQIQLPELRSFDPIPLCFSRAVFNGYFPVPSVSLHTTDPLAISCSLALAIFVPFPIHFVVFVISVLVYNSKGLRIVTNK